MNRKFLVITIAIGLVLTGFGLARFYPVAQAAEPAEEGTPSFHAYALTAPYPATIDPNRFSAPVNRNVYGLAARIKPVLFQQPCFCYCDRAYGHKSLLDCFSGTHGAECDVCKMEAVFAYQQTQKGKTPAQIRTAMIRGDWKEVDMTPYQKNLSLR